MPWSMVGFSRLPVRANALEYGRLEQTPSARGADDVSDDVDATKAGATYDGVVQDDDLVCNFCRERTEEPLIQPCACRGSMSGLHRTCLYKWIEHQRQRTSEVPHCTVCREKYRGRVTVPGMREFVEYHVAKRHGCTLRACRCIAGLCMVGSRCLFEFLLYLLWPAILLGCYIVFLNPHWVHRWIQLSLSKSTGMIVGVFFCIGILLQVLLLKMKFTNSGSQPYWRLRLLFQRSQHWESMLCQLWLLAFSVVFVSVASAIEVLPFFCFQKPDEVFHIPNGYANLTDHDQEDYDPAYQELVNVCAEELFKRGWQLLPAEILFGLVLFIDTSTWHRIRRRTQMFFMILIGLLFVPLASYMTLLSTVGHGSPSNSDNELMPAFVAEFVLIAFFMVVLLTMLVLIEYYRGWQARNTRFALLTEHLLDGSASADHIAPV